MVDWHVVFRALEQSQFDPIGAEELLKTAFLIDKPPVEPGINKIYGRDSYTDANDPRGLDCRSHQYQNGKPVAVHLQVHVTPSKAFRCQSVELLLEDNSSNVYFQVLDRNGMPLPGLEARLFSPYSGYADNFQSTWAAPASPYSIFMGRDSKFAEPNLGPIAAGLVDDQGNIISDVVGSMGLSRGEHMSYRVTFVRR